MTDDSRIRILHLDDEPTVLSATENYIERFADGVTVETTTDPEHALDRLETGQFDCLLSDYEMPRMDGLAVLDAVEKRGLAVPVVMYTGRGSEDVASEAFSKGAADYIPKGDGMDHYASLVADISAAVRTDDGDVETTATVDDDPAAATTAGDGPAAVTMSDERTVPDAADTAGTDQRVHALADWTRRVTSADSMAALHRETLAAVETVLGLSVAGIWCHDDDQRALVPEAMSGTTASPAEWPTVAAGSDTLLWDCYETGQVRSTASPADTGLAVATAPLERVLVASLGEYGVLVAGSADGTDETAIGETEKSLFDTLASSVTAAVDALDSRADARRTRAFTQGLLDSLPDMFYAFDENGNYYRWNDELLAASGYTEAEIETLRPWDLIPDHDADRIGEVIERIVETGTSDRVESWLETEDGREIPYEYTGAPIRDADGEVIGVAGIGRDIGEQRARQQRLEETKQRLDLALEATDTGVWEWNVDTDAVFWNDSTHRLFGVDPGEFGGTFEAFARQVHPDDQPDVREALDRALEDGEEYDPEFRVQQPDGEVRWMAARSELVTDDDGTRRMVGTITDITERREKERKLREHERRLRQISENVDDVVWMNTPAQDGIQFISDAYEDIWGRSTAALAENPEAFVEAIHPEDRERVVDAMAAQRQHPDSYDETYRVVQPDGEVRWVRDRSSGVYDEDGTLERIVGIATDITDRTEREQALAESEARFRSMAEALDTSSIGTIILDEDFSVVWTNEAIETYFSLDGGPVEGRKKVTLVDEEIKHIFEEPERFAETVTATYEDNTGIEQFECHVLPGEDREERWLLHRSVPIEQGQYAGGRVEHYTDITERKQREQELEETRQQLDLALGATNTGVWLLDTGTGTITPYGNTAELHGVDPGVTDGTAYGDKVHPDDLPNLESVFGASADPDSQLVAEFRVVHDGKIRWLRSRGQAVGDGTGPTRQILGVTTDITDRKEREQQLQRNRDFLEQTQELADVGGWEVDLRSDEPTWTDPIRNIVDAPPGYDPATLEEAIAYFHPDDREAVWDAIGQIGSGEETDLEVRVRTESGETRWVSTVGEPVSEDGDVVRIRGAMQDITDRKERERELERQNERLELLASTISHDLRNPLRSARTNLRMAQQEVESALLDDIAFAHERMAELISDLLTLARQGQAVTNTEPIDLATTAREVWDGVETADATLATDPVTVQADQSRLRQLFENLFVNSVEHGSTGNRTQSDDSVEHSSTSVHVRVGPTERGFCLEDDGPGVPEDEREAVFEYGYSTADTGTGFGLAIVEEIAEAHGWRVTLTESDDGGARFEFRVG